ncbi:MAG TPA: glycosyltransferase family 1 protein [Planctomycetota bacterium]|nr:glycosyltransferase family 1 protein [Planctomycetota bacterium]
MIVVFDGACLGDGPITGVGRAFLNGLQAYVEAAADDCVLLVPRGAPSPPLDVRVVEAPRGALQRQLALPRLLRQLGADVLHSSVAAVPLRAPCPTIATVHDLPWLHAGLGEPSTGWRRFATTRALRAASAVLAPSRFTLADAARLLGCSDTLHLVPHGTPRADDVPIDARTGPLLVLGDDRPRKNRERVRRAHVEAAARDPRLPALRFVGPPDAWVDEAAKRYLLRSCFAIVQGSWFEGFGMPVLEAMAHAAPIACSDIAPFREVAGEAAVFFDPHDVASIASALLRLTDRSLRERLAGQGWQRAASFSPQRTAASWRSLHERLVAR